MNLVLKLKSRKNNQRKKWKMRKEKRSRKLIKVTLSMKNTTSNQYKLKESSLSINTRLRLPGPCTRMRCLRFTRPTSYPFIKRRKKTSLVLKTSSARCHCSILKIKIFLKEQHTMKSKFISRNNTKEVLVK